MLIDALYSFRALNLAILISFDLTLAVYSCCDSSSFSSFPKNLFNNLFEKLSEEFFKSSNTFFLMVKNKLIGFSLSLSNLLIILQKIIIKTIEKLIVINNITIFLIP